MAVLQRKEIMSIEVSTALSGILVCIMAYQVITYLWRKVFRYPETPFGFRGKLIFADDEQENAKVFRNQRYGVSCRPDFIYKLESGKLCYIEAKSRKKAMESDVVQLEVGIIAIRSELNIRAGGILQSNNQIKWVPSAKKSSSALYRKNKGFIRMARKIKSGHQPPIKRSDQCVKCPFKPKCFPN